jgi:ring-1,2-phenylacetyl-CoA epoxidase subunit PaaE
VKFESLTIGAVEPICEDGLVITFAVPPAQRDTFAFRPGQHLTVDETLRRSYSICSTPAELTERGVLRIAMRLIPGGEFTAIAAKLGAGDSIRVMPPLGGFTSDFAPTRRRAYGAIVAGSGITPVLSIAATALATEPASTFAIICGNRTSVTAFAVDELADLKDRFPDRLQVLHVLSRESGTALHGRLTPEVIESLLPLVGSVDEWFLCGPLGMVEGARGVLTGRGAKVHVELFHTTAPPAPAVASEATTEDVAVTITLDGRVTNFTMGSSERVLDAALRHRPELPFACRGGVCSTCRAKLVEGTVEMAANWALDPSETEAGYILTCQSNPTSHNLVVDYDA